MDSDSLRLVEWSQCDQQAPILCAKATSFHSFGAEDLRLLSVGRPNGIPGGGEKRTPDHLRPSYGFNSFTPGTPLNQQGRRALRGRHHGDVDLNIDACIYITCVICQEMSFPFMAFRVEMIFEYPDDSRLLYVYFVELSSLFKGI